MTMEGKRFLPNPYFFLIKLCECIQSLIQSCTVVNNLKTYGHCFKLFFFEVFGEETSAYSQVYVRGLFSKCYIYSERLRFQSKIPGI